MAVLSSSSSSSSSSASWKHTILLQLKQRNNAETEPFRRMIECSNQSSRQIQALKQCIENQEKELVILRHESINKGGETETRDEKVVKLQRKVQKLQEELTEKLRLELQGATSQLNMTKEIQDMYQKWQTARTEADALRAEIEGFRERESALVAKAEQCQADLELVKAELGRLRVILETTEKERDALRQQNEELITRMVGEKSSNAEEMNRMTELVEQMRAQLKAQGIALAASSSTPNHIGALVSEAQRRGDALSSSAAKAMEVPSACIQQFKAHASDVNDLAYNETGQLLATSGSDGKVRVWEALSGRLRATLQGQDVMLGLHIKGDFVVAGSSDNTCKMWNVSTERIHRSFVGHSGNVYAVKIMADARSIMTGAADRTIRLWDVGRGNCKQVLRSGSTCNGLDISIDGNVPVSAHQDGGLRLWDLRSGNSTMIVRAFDTQATSVSYGNNFTILANSRDNAIKIIDSRTFETLHTLRHPEYRTFLNWSRACFSPSNTYVAAGSASGAIFIWHVESEEVKAILPNTGNVGVTNCAWGWGSSFSSIGRASPRSSGIRLATGDKSGFVHCWG